MFIMSVRGYVLPSSNVMGVVIKWAVYDVCINYCTMMYGYSRQVSID
jgi:hypothetical protein